MMSGLPSFIHRHRTEAGSVAVSDGGLASISWVWRISPFAKPATNGPWSLIGGTAVQSASPIKLRQPCDPAKTRQPITPAATVMVRVNTADAVGSTTAWVFMFPSPLLLSTVSVMVAPVSVGKTKTGFGTGFSVAVFAAS